MQTSKIVLLSGGNEGDVRSTILRARQELEFSLDVSFEVSPFCVSEAWGFQDAKLFYNQVWTFEHSIAPHKLFELLVELEKKAGRVRTNNPGYSSRSLDLDILFYGSSCLNTHQLQIPHPRLHLRKFTLLPLNSLIPDFIHPTLLKSISELLNDCEDQSMAKLE